MTDNRNRTAPEIRKIFEVNQGKLGATNCVAWMFHRKGLIIISSEKADEETLMELVLEAGADDIKSEKEFFEITCSVEAYSGVCEALNDAKIEVESSQITRIPSNTVELDTVGARSVLKLMEALDDHDDVQNVSANFDISDETMAELEKS